MANRNRTAGNNFERLIVKELKEMGYDVVTSRSESKSMDDKKVDIFSPMGAEKVFPFYIQAKCTGPNPDYCGIMKAMPKDRPPIVFHRKTKKAEKLFLTQGDFVIMPKEIFYKLLNEQR